MERSPDETLSQSLQLKKLTTRVEELRKYYPGDSRELLPMQFKETSPVVPTSAMVIPGEWHPIDDPHLPVINLNSLVWLRKRFAIPELPDKWTWNLELRFAGIGEKEEPVEGCAWINGTVRQGIDVNHAFIPLGDLSPDQEHELTLRVNYKPQHEARIIKTARMTAVHLPSFHLYHALECILEIVKTSDTTNLSIRNLLDIIEKTLRPIPFTDPGSDRYYEEVARAWENFSFPENWERVSPTLRSFGHAHIDVAWLWTIDETRRKTVQTFASACSLLKEYTDFTFLQSQPVLYEFVERQEPELFGRIQGLVSEKRWIPEGSSWVEMDCNIPAGESLIRQILHGKRYFREKFGIDTLTMWLPDTFGFNGNLPQILKKSGVPYFSTSKISWSTHTRFPYDAFRWRGIDGSEVLAMYLTAHHRKFDTAATYNGMLTPPEIKNAWTSFAQKNVFDEVMISFGYGDGGGGPTREMLERVPILKDAPGLPKLQMGSPAETFQLLADSRGRLPVWHGELYLEYHRGTLTSRHGIKQAHRRAEAALALLEKAVSLDLLWRRRRITGEERESLNYMWKTLLTNQFHDIIAGSSIHGVNEEAETDLARIYEEASRQAQRIITSWHQRREPIPTDNAEAGEMVFNPHSFPVAQIAGNLEKNVCHLSFEGPFQFFSPEGLADRGVLFSPITVTDYYTIDTAFIRLEINEHGEIVSLIDKRIGDNENLIKPGESANSLRFFEDRPVYWDAWDIDEHYKDSPLEKPELIQSSWQSVGPTRAVYRVIKQFRESVILQDIIFYAQTPRIDFRTRIDWHNKNVLIKAAFPFNLNTREAVYEIPFGFIKRPTHTNRPSDRAMFEVSAQRWAAMFETGRGAAVLNNGKYGYSAEESTLSLSLLRSATSPDPDGEEGIHEFTYSLLPCFESSPTSEIIWEASLLNQPLVDVNGPPRKDSEEKRIPEGPFPKIYSRSTGNHVVLETLKPAEEGEGLIVRLYESLNRRGTAHITLPASTTGVKLVDLMENELEEVEVKVLPGQDTGVPGIVLHFEPFEIKSFKLFYEIEDSKG